MGESLEELRAGAERLSGAGLSAEASQAWRELAAGAEEAYGEGDPRPLAAAGRMMRESALAGSSGAEASGPLLSAARIMAGALGPGSPEPYMLEETAHSLRAGTDPAGSAVELAGLAARAEAALGPGHPQTLSVRRALASALMAGGALGEASSALSPAAGACVSSFGPGCRESLETMNLLAEAMAARGDHCPAADLLAAALGIADGGLGPGHRTGLFLAVSLGRELRLSGRLREAREHMSGTLAAAEAALGAGDRLAGSAMHELGLDMLELGELEEAETLWRRILETRIREEGPEGPGALAAANNLAAALRARGGLAAARDMLAACLDASVRTLGADSPGTLVRAGHLASVLYDLGNLNGARALLERTLAAREAAQGPGDPDTEAVRANLALAMAELGELAAARELNERALHALESSLGPEHPVSLSAANNLAWTLYELGDYAAAMPAFRRVAEARAGALGPDHPQTLESLASLAASMHRLGDARGAYDLTSRALAEAEARLGPRHPSVLAIKANTAAALENLGEPEAAAELFREVLDARMAVLDAGHPDIVESALVLAASRLRLGDAPAARAVGAAALATAAVRLGPSHPLASRSAAFMGEAWAASGDRAAAVFFLKVAVDSAQKERATLGSMDRDTRRGYLSTVAGSYRRLFGHLVREGRNAEALAVLGLLKEEERFGLDRASWGAEEPKARTEAVPAAARAPGAAGGSPGRAAAGAGGDPPAASGFGAAPDLFGGTRDGEAWQAFSSAAGHSAALERERAGLEAARTAGGLREDAGRRLSELPGLISAEEAGLVGLLGRIPELLAVPGVGEGLSRPSWAAERLAERQAALGSLGRGTVLLNAVSADDGLFLVLVAPDSVTARSSGTGHGEIAVLAREFRRAVADRTADPRAEAGRLYDALLGPVDGDLESAGASTVMLSLDQELRYAPVAALWDGEGWLVERYPVSLFTEATALRMGDPPFEGEATVSAMGVTRAWPGFPALPGVAGELAAVVRTSGTPGGALRGTSVTDGDFTRASLAEGLSSGAPVVHVASHFRLDPRSLENSALLLGDGGTLSLGEIRSGRGLDFRGLDLLTLSACDTASGAGRGDGRDVESLGEVVQRAGASAVLAAVMPVADRSVPDLMREFYRLRYSGGASKAEALRGAQLKMMRGGGPDAGAARGKVPSLHGEASVGNPLPGTPGWDGKGTSHPYYWAPFVLMGNWR
jgi:CHAT domain-containing protein/tetratricopeptide (TPR) repeat protein